MPSKTIINLITFEDGISNVGFRRISSLVKRDYPLTTTYFYNVSNISVQAFNILKTFNGQEQSLNPLFIQEVCKGEVIAFSGMSKFHGYVKDAIQQIRKKNPKALIVWGGVHATVFPDDAIKYADAVCIGEGEKSLPSLLKLYESGGDISYCEGFWVKRNGNIIKNPLPSLMEDDELSLQPLQDYSFDIKHVTNSKIELMTRDVYISQLGTKYMTMWSLGCPFRCIYCSNSKFLKNHPDYGKIRKSNPEYIINEILNILKIHDYVSYIELEDDNILLIDKENLRQFASLYKKEVNLPLFIPGLHPLTFSKEKLDILLGAGLKKVRMGIQSGCQSTLQFYRRNTNPQKMLEVTDILGSYYPKIIPPFYDIIIDNPVETEEEKNQTLSFLKKVKRPYLLYIYSLRVIPGTELDDFVKNHPEYSIPEISHSYQDIFDKRMGLMVYLLGICNPPDRIYNLFLYISKNRKISEVLLPVIKIIYMFKRFYYEIKVSNYQPIAMISPKLAIVTIKFITKIRNMFRSNYWK